MLKRIARAWRGFVLRTRERQLQQEIRLTKEQAQLLRNRLTYIEGTDLPLLQVRLTRTQAELSSGLCIRVQKATLGHARHSLLGAGK